MIVDSKVYSDTLKTSFELYVKKKILYLFLVLDDEEKKGPLSSPYLQKYDKILLRQENSTLHVH